MAILKANISVAKNLTGIALDRAARILPCVNMSGALTRAAVYGGAEGGILFLPGDGGSLPVPDLHTSPLCVPPFRRDPWLMQSFSHPDYSLVRL